MGGQTKLPDGSIHVRPSVSNGEEIAGMLMQVAEKTDRCWNFDLQHWLTLYQRVRMQHVNFPEAAMLVSCAAQIYGRKVDYLSDIVVHMNDDQKAREKKTMEEEKNKAGEEVGAQGETSSKTPGRKRAGRFNPQSLSDCFGDLEFSCNDKKLLKLESLVKSVPIVDVDRRTKVQQMQDLCMELRANPSRQRKQEILNRLRDDACIAPIMSSNGASRKNQIADLESGDAIGTRYDYQIHLNYIDGRTGSLIAEHDLKRFFQRCDVIDFLFEQRMTERERCTSLGMEAPADRLSYGERGIKLYMPPEYLNNRYRIKVNDTTDFDNALIQARVTNYNSDPILSLMDHALRAEKLAAESFGLNDSLEQSKTSDTLNDSGFGNSTTKTDLEDPSLTGVLSSTHTDDSMLEPNSVVNSTETSFTALSQESGLETSQEDSIEREQLESSLAEDADSSMKQNSTDKTITALSRLSVDEGIGVDRETTPPRTTQVNLLEESIIKPRLVIFTPGTVFPRPSTGSRPAKLVQNMFGIPEDLARKHVQFALPMEYRKLKIEFVKRHEQDRAKELSCVQLQSLKSTANSILRPSTPDEEDFLGFPDETEQLTPVKSSRKTKCSSPSVESSPAKQNRTSTTEQNFKGFDEEEILAARKVVADLTKRFMEKPKHPCSPSKRTNGSLPGTPTRTLSCDSGISDTVERTGRQPCAGPMANSLLDSIDEHIDDSECDLPALDTQAGQEGVMESVSHQAPSQHHTDACNARIEEKMNEAKERFDKVSLWHRNLKPILMESEKRTHFDIHAYGTEIIDTFDPNVPLGSESITLEKVLSNKPPHSTARFFLSVLMLANTSNIEINNRNQDPHRLSTTGEIDLRLLSRKRHHKELEALGEILPPSSSNGTDAKERCRDKRQNRKRKHLQLEQDVVEQNHSETNEESTIVRPDPSSRLGGLDDGLDGCDDGASFFDNVQQVYAELNSERAQHKRLAFRRGMRHCAYGLTDSESNPKDGKELETVVAQPESPARTKVRTPLDDSCLSVSKPRIDVVRTICPSPIMSDSGEDLLTVDLLTNQATLVPAASAADQMCAKSVFSLAESGYESMLSLRGDDV
uniref:Condensin-2 complex subunit H2 C-terminal domain-containing protein n=1 Tax=Anopheles culicifacies TaxID=139723 RepID=A0A182MWP6_9DIPT